MNYTIRELEVFSVIGQEVELTNYQKRNIQISTQFWRKFNSNLKKLYFSQSGNWIKYAFMERKNGKLFYFCSIPKRNVVPDSFIYKEVPPYKYLVVEHIGSLGKIYETYGFAISLYKDYRGFGIGTDLMKEMLRILKERGYKQASLAVQKANYAVRMYQKTGFEEPSCFSANFFLFLDHILTFGFYQVHQIFS